MNSQAHNVNSGPLTFRAKDLLLGRHSHGHVVGDGEVVDALLRKDPDDEYPSYSQLQEK